MAKCPKLGDIWAYVEDESGKSIEGVPVTGPGNKDTDPTGLASFEKLAEGKYDVTLGALKAPVSDDYVHPKKITESAKVKTGQVTTVRFVLRLRPIAKINVDDPKIIIVHRPYKDKLKKPLPPHLIPVTMGYDGNHDGDVVLDSPQKAGLKLFSDDKGKKEIKLPYTVKAKDAKSGKTVYMSATAPSGANQGTELSVELKNGSIPPKKPKADEKITCVELKLDVYKARPLNGADPAIWPEDKKIKPGHSLIVQNAGLWSQREKLVLYQAKPADFPGKIKLVPMDAKVAAYAAEKPATGDAALAAPALEFDNPAVNAANGQIFWMQAQSKSGAFGDTGWTVEASDVPGEEGDRVTMSALEMDLRVYKSTPAKKKKPEEMDKAGQLSKGRYLHKQDADHHHGRAKLVIHRLEPPGFDGQVFLSCWDIQTAPPSEAKSGAPKVKLFTEETGGAEQAFETGIAHPAGAPKELKTLWVEGASNSAALRDSQIRLGVKDVCHANDRGALTVVEFTKIKATIKSTPPLTARPGIALPVDHTFENSAKYSEDFAAGKNPPLVIVRNGRDDIALEVTTVPAAPVDLDITWRAVRNKDDHKSLGKDTDLPTVTRDPADKRKATLQCNQKGSFHIRPYIDCNDVDEYSPKEPSIPLNLVLADAKLVRDNSKGFKRNLTAALGGGIFNVRNGTWPNTWAACIAAGGAGMTMELIADVTGGGADGRLGLDSVFGGLINMLSDNQITLTYTDIITPVPLGGAAATLTVRNRYVLNRPAATGNYGGTPMFIPADPAPNLLAFPVLDTGRPNGGLGGESATMSRSGGWDLLANRSVGKRYTLRCIDSPGRGFLLVHPTNGNSGLTNVHYVQAFRANFCFWTNITNARGTTGDPCDRVYSVIRTMDWEAHGDWTIAWNNPGAGWVQTLTVTTPHDIQVSNPATVNPLGAADQNGVEVRPPSGITSAIAWETT
ncbi:MAG: hypothetical protein JNK48_03485 [Bryobacterales bacterium]|nr:hypothetical protein [Bryobacterales bacterium]